MTSPLVHVSVVNCLLPRGRKLARLQQMRVGAEEWLSGPYLEVGGGGRPLGLRKNISCH